MAPASEMTKIVRKRLEEVCKDFSVCVKSLGFLRTKKMLWTRRRPLTVDFIHFYRSGSSYGAPISVTVDIDVSFGIRVLNDTSHIAILSGPRNDPTLTRKGRYHHRFSARSGHMCDRCVHDLVRFVEEEGEPWFQRFANIDKLLNPVDSPLKPEARELLNLARIGKGNPDNEAAVLKNLGIKEKKKREK
jgi:hypothetical protein